MVSLHFFQDTRQWRGEGSETKAHVYWDQQTRAMEVRIFSTSPNSSSRKFKNGIEVTLSVRLRMTEAEGTELSTRFWSCKACLLDLTRIWYCASVSTCSWTARATLCHLVSTMQPSMFWGSSVRRLWMWLSATALLYRLRKTEMFSPFSYSCRKTCTCSGSECTSGLE